MNKKRNSELIEENENYNNSPFSNRKNTIYNKSSRSLIDDFNEIKHKPTISNFDVNYSEGISVILFLASSITFGICAFMIKHTSIIFSNVFNPDGFLVWRSLSIIVYSLFFIKYKNDRLINIIEVENKLWFLIRTAGNYITIKYYISCVMILRASTTACISSMYPILVLIFSIFILKEKFYIRYIIGLIICLSGTVMIVLNEKNVSVPNLKDHTDDLIELKILKNNDSKLIVGISYGLLHLLFIALVTIATKIISKERISVNEQCFYMALSNMIIGIIVCIFDNGLGFDMYYIIYVFINGFLFLCFYICFFLLFC